MSGRTSTVAGTDPVAAAWRARAVDLATWTRDRIVVRTDVWGAFLPVARRNPRGSKQYTAPAKERRADDALKLPRIAGHYSGVAAHDVIGLHVIGRDGMSRCAAVDQDRHTDDGDPESNRKAIVALYDRLRAIGFRPLLYTSDERGGHHLRVIFANPVPSRVAHAFALWMAGQVDAGAEAFPKQPELTAEKPYGSWMRLPGRHHTRDGVWSTVYDGATWLEGTAAVDHVLAIAGDDGALIPPEAEPKVATAGAGVGVELPTVDMATDVSVGRRVDRCRRFLAAIPRSVSNQKGHDRLLHAACECRRFDVPRVDARALLAEFNATASPPWPDAELDRKLDEAEKLVVNGTVGSRLRDVAAAKPSRPADEADEFAASLTEAHNARELVKRYGAGFRWYHERGLFLTYDADGGRWSEDTTGQVNRHAKAIAAASWADVANLAGPDRKAAIAHATRSETARGIGAAMTLARSEPGVTVTARELDADPWLLNVANGVVDLHTGRLRPHAPELLLTRHAPVAYDLRATCPTFDRFMARIMDGNADLTAYLQRVHGLCLTGDISVQELFVFWGSGANGKSVLCDTFGGLLGDYAGLAPPALLTMRTNDEHPTEIADLQGRRCVFASETEEGAKLRIQLVKRLTGDATLKGRFMRQDYFEFPRTFKLVLATNNKPKITENTNAIWRRLRLVPFAVVIPPDEQDPHLIARLRAEWPGILAWAVRGCVDWQRNGMQTPAAVSDATAAYQAEQDVLTDYLAARCVRGPQCRVGRSELFADYQSWAHQTGERHPLERNALFDRVRRLDDVSDGQWKPVGVNVPVRGFRGLGLSYPGGTP